MLLHNVNSSKSVLWSSSSLCKESLKSNSRLLSYGQRTIFSIAGVHLELCCLWYDGKRGKRGDSKFSNRPVTFESNQIWKLRRSLSKSYIRCLWACIFSGHWDLGDVKARNGPKFEFFSNFWPILWNPLAKVDGSMPECAQVRALHMRPHLTLLRINVKKLP